MQDSRANPISYGLWLTALLAEFEDGFRQRFVVLARLLQKHFNCSAISTQSSREKIAHNCLTLTNAAQPTVDSRVNNRIELDFSGGPLSIPRTNKVSRAARTCDQHGFVMTLSRGRA